MAKQAKEKQQTIEGTDTPLTQIADDFLDARDAVNNAKADLSKAELNLIGALGDIAKHSVKHRGYTLKLTITPGKEKITVKS